jgi:hypothetical protein
LTTSSSRLENNNNFQTHTNNTISDHTNLMMGNEIENKRREKQKRNTRSIPPN